MRETYRNILELIEINESIKYSCQKTLMEIEVFLLKQACPKGYSTGTSYVDADRIRGSSEELGAIELERMIHNITLMREIIEQQTKILAELYSAKGRMDERLSRLSGIEYEVGYLRLVEGLPLSAIADRLNVSYGYVRNINSRI